MEETKMNKQLILVISLLGITLTSLILVFTGTENIYIPIGPASTSFMQYNATGTTCNDTLGKPDVDCFLNAFEECKSASIKNKVNTVEGDPIFLYADIMSDCQISVRIDNSLDKFSGKLTEDAICFDVKLDEIAKHLLFSCDDSGDFRGFPVW